MLIQNLSLKNFKCFEEVDVEFAPITLLTGANSSGKSSLIYSLLIILQDNLYPYFLSSNGKFINLGSFDEIVLNSNKSKTFHIKTFFTYPIPKTPYLSKEKFELTTEWKKNKLSNQPTLKNLNVDLEDWTLVLKENKGKVILNLNDVNVLNFFSSDFESDIFKLETSINKEGKKADSLSAKNVKFNSFEDFYSRVIASDDKSVQTSKIRREIPEILDAINDKFNYIGSFRLPPERTYYQKAKVEEKISVDGAGYIDQIIEWEETNPEKLAELAKIMSELELFQEIRSNKFKGGRFELAVKTQKNSEMAALTDVGFGISQFLPIIVADLQLDDQSCLALSQPEIHLHPKIQALFGNFLANQVKRTQKQYIVETHSEYLLNRIRLLLVKGELKPEDVRVYYFENDGIKTTTHKVEFATDGQIKGAPQGFFDTYAIDVMDIAMNSFAD